MNKRERIQALEARVLELDAKLSRLEAKVAEWEKRRAMEDPDRLRRPVKWPEYPLPERGTLTGDPVPPLYRVHSSSARS